MGRYLFARIVHDDLIADARTCGRPEGLIETYPLRTNLGITLDQCFIP